MTFRMLIMALLATHAPAPFLGHCGAEHAAFGRPSLSVEQAKILDVADRLLEEAKVSYVYGGFQIGDPKDCGFCSACLDEKKPAPRRRLELCPSCQRCSLDCSHFTALVYRDAGLAYPYLNTALMLEAPARRLAKVYSLVDLGVDLAASTPGDLLVYDGHVVLLERRHASVAGLPTFRGDVVHATGGRDLRGGGAGIQRERFVDLAQFRGSLRRILRHSSLALEPQKKGAALAPKGVEAPATPRFSRVAPAKRLRPVRSPEGD